MAVPKSTFYTCLWLMYLMTPCNTVEPHCSKFPYEEALLEKLVRLEFKVEQMDSGIRAVQENVIEELNKLKKEREESVAFQKQLEEEIRENPNKMPKEIAAETSNILFRACNVSDLYPLPGQTIVYTDVMTNQGSSYDPLTGIFTAPRAGLYLFSTQFCIPNRRYFHFAFYVDGIIEQPMSISTYRPSCFTSVMPIELTKSSEVSVNSTFRADYLDSGHNRWNIFSGVLIKPVYDD